VADLRDQLLKAGLVSKQAKHAADTDARKQRKQRSREESISEARQKARQFEEQRSRQALENREREARRQTTRLEEARRRQVRSLAGSWAIREARPGPRRWCFVTRDGRIRWFDVSAWVGWQLEVGNLAIVERPGDDDEPHAIVPRTVAERIVALDPDFVRFWNRAPTDPAAGG
jgi:uncharacterized protein YaiL (DUF2058 family)